MCSRGLIHRGDRFAAHIPRDIDERQAERALSARIGADPEPSHLVHAHPVL